MLAVETKKKRGSAAFWSRQAWIVFSLLQIRSSPSAPVELPVSEKNLQSDDLGRDRRYFLTQTAGLLLLDALRDTVKGAPLNSTTPAVVWFGSVVQVYSEPRSKLY